jgi:hypothetical protein
MAVMRCEQLREVAPDVALGLLTGEERAAALAHLDRCESCRAEVASLAGVVDEVLLVGPEATPPAGFAPGVLTHLAGERAGREGGADTGPGVGSPAAAPAPARRSWRRRGAVALAAAAALVIAVGLGLTLPSDQGPDPVVATAAMRTGRGEVVGEATVTGDDDASVTVDVPEWEAMVDRWGAAGDDYWVAVETTDGARAMRPAAGGDGEGWSVTVDVAAEDVATVAVLDAEGRVWCSGRFAT